MRLALRLSFLYVVLFFLYFQFQLELCLLLSNSSVPNLEGFLRKVAINCSIQVAFLPLIYLCKLCITFMYTIYFAIYFASALKK